MLFEVLISIGTGLKVKFPIEFLQNITSYNLLYLLTKINIRTESDVLIEELQVRSLGSVPLYVMHPKN